MGKTASDNSQAMLNQVSKQLIARQKAKYHEMHSAVKRLAFIIVNQALEY